MGLWVVEIETEASSGIRRGDSARRQPGPSPERGAFSPRCAPARLALCVRRGSRVLLFGLLLASCLSGCRLPPPPRVDDLGRNWTRRQPVAQRAADQLHESREFHASAGQSAAGAECDDDLGTPATTAELHHLDGVVQEVLRTNPTLEAAEATWEAALQQYPQVTSLDDPAFRFLNGPTLFGPSGGAHLWRLQAQQKVPWFGKRGLRGEIADHEADLAHFAWRQTRQGLVAMATQTYLEYALVERLHALAMEDLRLAEAAIEGGEVELVGATLESLSQQEERELQRLELQRTRRDLESTRQRTAERLNVLLKRDPHAPLPPPQLPPLPAHQPRVEQLTSQALQHRPEMAIATRREQLAEAQIELAEKEFYPDMEFVGRFDTTSSEFWMPDSAWIRPQLGVYVYPPVQQRRRWAKVRQTQAVRRQRKAETVALQAKIRSEIKQAVAELERTRERVASLDRLIAVAQRRAASREVLVAWNQGADKELITAQRTVLKYQRERLQEEVALLQKFADLTALSGAHAWDGHDPAEYEAALEANFLLLPDTAREVMDSLRAWGSD